MSTIKDRAEKTRKYIADPEVTFSEATVHLYFWLRFEWAINQRDRHARLAKAYSKVLNRNLDVVQFRKDVKETINNLAE